MRCLSCKAEVPVTEKVCPSCGAENVAGKDDVKSLEQITLDWLASILVEEGYDVKKGEESFLAIHDRLTDLMVTISPSLQSIMFLSFWKTSVPSQKEHEFLSALNKANRKGIIFLFSADETSSHDVRVIGSISITEKVSRRDILKFLYLYDDSVWALTEEHLAEFLT
jgi:hypothetical protein